MPALLRSCTLVEASVTAGTPLLAAVQTLVEARVAAVAVLGENRRVVGLLSEDDVVRALFPGYLGDLHHTAFLDEESQLAAHADRLTPLPVEKAARSDAEPVPIDTSVIHVAQRFLHIDWGAVPVVDESDRFLGMLPQAEFIRVVVEHLPSR